MYFNQKGIKQIITAVGLLLTVVLLVAWRTGSQYGREFFFQHYHYYDILFTETSGRANLSARQACAVESAARHHPYSKVQVWMFTSKLIQDNFDLSRAVPNVNMIRANLDDFFERSPLHKWYNSRNWEKSVHRVTHLSDAVRYLLVWKFGGVYLDLDVVVLKCFYGLENFLVKENMFTIASSVFGFDSKHDFLSLCLKQLEGSYNKNSFACIGPDLITKSFRRYCFVSHVYQAERRNCSLNVLPSTISFPLLYERWREVFYKSSTRNVMTRIKNSISVHLWNARSRNKKLVIGSGSAYEELMKVNCPHVYKSVLKTSKSI